MKSKHAILSISVITLLLLLFQFAPLASAQGNSRTSWTFMVYMDADNNLDTFGPYNLQQMSNGLAPGVNVNVIVLMARLNPPAYTYEVTHGSITKIQSFIDGVDMGNPKTLTSFLTFAITNYPATNYFLDVWDHGGGISGVCWDQSSGNHLSPHDLENAIALAEFQTGEHIQIVGFDACLMGMMEVTYELKDVTNIVIGSEMLIPGYGWPYTQLTTYLSDHPNIDQYTLSAELVSEYVTAYPHFKVQLSAINETAIPNLAASLDAFADALRTGTYGYQGAIAGARGDAQQNFILGKRGYNYIDLYKFARLVGQKTGDLSIQNLAADLMNKVDAAVFAQAYLAKQGNMDAKEFGLSIYFPPNAQSYSISYETDVPYFVQATSWQPFLMAYYGAM